MYAEYIEQIDEYMDEHGLNQKQLAKKLGVSGATVSNILNQRTIPSDEMLEIISQKTGIKFQKWDDPMELVDIEEAAYLLNMSAYHLKKCLLNHAFDYQFGVATEGVNRYIIWRDKLEKFMKM